MILVQVVIKHWLNIHILQLMFEGVTEREWNSQAAGGLIDHINQNVLRQE